MPKTRKQKESSVEDIKKDLGAKGTVVFVGFNKFKIADERVLRTALRADKVGFKVAKKSLLTRALADAGHKIGELPGQVAIAFGDDAVLPAKGIADFAKKHEGVVSILGGIFEGAITDASKMQMIGSLPSREALLSMLANVLQAPIRGFAIAVSAIAEKKSQPST
jgi:large subunit ribosomal protein L10